MRIQRIAVGNFRKLRDPVEIEGLQPGLNVIVGDNEEGKSTLLKAVQAAFFDKHSMTGQAVEAMLPFGSRVQPNVEVEFEIGGVGYSLRKGFFQNKFAQLKGAEGSWENAAAEDKLKKILGFTSPSQGSAKDKNRGLSGPLWVEQGRAYESLKFNEDAKKALDEAIEQELEAANAGDDGRELLSDCRVKVGIYYTPITGAEKRILTDQRELVASLEQELQSLTQKIQEYDGKLNDIEEIMREVPKLKKDCKNAQREVDSIRVKVGQVEKTEGKVANAKEKVEAANARFETANLRFQARTERKEEFDNKERDAKRRRKEFSILDKGHKDAKRKLEISNKELQKAQIECKRAELKASSDKLAKAKTIAKKIAKNEEAIEEIPISNEDADDLRRLQGKLNIQQARLEAMATTLVFSPSRNQSVSTNGEQVEIDEPRRITEKALFELKGFGELAVTPGGDEEDIRECRSLVNALNKQLIDGLSALRYSSVEEADEAWTRKEELLNEIGMDEAELQRLAPEGLESLRLGIERLREDLPQEAAESETPVLSVDEAGGKKRDAQRKWEDANQDFSTIQGTWNHEKGAIRQLEENIAQLKAGLDRDRELNPDEVLEENSRNAEEAHQKRQSKLNKLNAELRELNPDSTRNKLVDKEQFHGNLQSLLDTKTQQKNALEGELRGLGALGLEEEIGKKHRECEAARKELERLVLDAEAWKLLRDTLLKAQDEERVPITPLVKCLALYVGMVFPDANLHLNEHSLEIDRLHRGGDEPFDSLSIGTREQIAVLVRLAMADLLREQGKPVMLILDDPLVNSDDGRFKGMARALRKAARNLQILILTCHEHRYKSLGAKIIRLMDAENQASIADLLAMPNAAGIDSEPARLSGDLCKPADLT